MIEKSWHLLPTYRVMNGRCTCRRGCSSPGKHPQTRNGVFDATNDSRIIEAWIKKDPFLQLAVRTGEESGVWVLDVDFKNTPDMDFWDKAEIDRLFDFGTRTVSTPRGYHFYFQWQNVVRNRVGIYPRVDARGKNGYVILPTGESEYSWVGNNPIIAAPDWLLEKVLGT